MSDFVSKVVGAASQGAVGAVVGASLSSVTEPIVNRVLVERKPLQEALKALQWEKVSSFAQTAMATNFIKFPFFEATNVIMNSFGDLPPTLRGATTGAIFCSATLPITNYRFRASMGGNAPIKFSDLYQAYLPTVGRDIIYGITRNKVMTFMISLNPERAKTNAGRFVNMFVTVIVSCVVSAPGNELRGYTLQAPERRLPFNEFFKPDKFVRSTAIGGMIMAVSLGIGTLATPKVEDLVAKIKAYLQAHPTGYLLLILFALHQVLERRRNQAVVKALEDKQAAK